MLNSLFLSLKNNLAQRNKVIQPNNERIRYCVLIALLVLLIAAGIAFFFGYRAGFHFLNDRHAILPDNAWILITFLGDTSLVLAVLVLFLRRYPHLVYVSVLSGIYAGIFNNIIKYSVDALRPGGVFDTVDYYAIGPTYVAHSFPSGHTTSAFVVAFLMLLYGRNRWLTMAVFAVALLVGLSRVMVGIHWPVDVLAGIASAALMTSLAMYSTRWLTFGIKPYGHLSVLILLLGVAMSLWWHDGGYTAIAGFAKSVAIIVPLVLAWQYIYIPYKEWLKNK